MSDADDKTQSAPFRRGQITWGRPPQAAFHVGPLPRDEGLARLTAMPPHPKPPQPKPAQPQPAQQTPPRSAPAAPLSAPRPSGVFGGSMVPRRQPAPTAAPQPPAPQPAAPQPSGAARPTP
ncbi:hypothetical protein ABE406_12835, partial [Brevundimonas naejangsanensis]